ncbi:ABC transporter substrate-binding protein [Halobellus sp. GM3]|uniref:ABC transporter substrate-binding protein n=1 Tax=Halobellus sp. GM3 TaxID=3458410 RepID=UPI00403DE119
MASDSIGERNAEKEPEALADELEDSGRLESLPLGRRKFIALAHGFGGTAALTALAGCSGGGGNGTATEGGSSGGTATQTPAETQQQKSEGEMDTVNASILPLLSSIPLYVAQSEGYFEEENIEVNLAKSISGAKETSRLATGQLDLTGGSIGASTLNAINRGIGMRVVADRVKFLPKAPSLLQMQINSSQYQEGMTLADTEGMVYATNGTANVSTYTLGRVLTAHGLTMDDIELKTMPFPQMISAFEGDSIDAAMNIGALGTQTRSKGLAQHAEYVSRTSPRVQIGNIIMSSAFMNQRPDVAKRWLKAYIKGIRRYYELGPYSDEVVSTYTEATDSPAVVMKGAPPVYLNRNGLVNEDSLLRQQDFFDCRGKIDSKVKKSEMIDLSLTKEAASEIGEVENPLLSESEISSVLGNAGVDLPEPKSQMVPDSNSCGGVQGL